MVMILTVFEKPIFEYLLFIVGVISIFPFIMLIAYGLGKWASYITRQDSEK